MDLETILIINAFVLLAILVIIIIVFVFIRPRKKKEGSNPSGMKKDMIEIKNHVNHGEFDEKPRLRKYRKSR